MFAAECREKILKMKMPTASKVNIDAIENRNMRQQGCYRAFILTTVQQQTD